MTQAPQRWPDAVLAGLACSMRSTAGPAMLAVRGRIEGAPRIGVLIATAGELAADKTPVIPDRTGAPALAGRVGAGAFTGRAVAGMPGLAAGAAGAAIGSFASWRARKLVVDTTGLPDAVVAVGEDILALAVAAAATRSQSGPAEEDTIALSAVGDDGAAAPEPPPAPPQRSLLRDAGAGLIAGLAGTAAMTIAQGAEFALTDAEPSTAPADIADKLKRRAGRGKLKRSQRRVANQVMHWLFGTSWGIPYGIVAAGSRVQPEVSGPVFGLLVWTAALGHQPALGIAEVPWKRSPASLGSEALFHLVYGLGAGAALRAVRNALEG
jgi:uncharacterized membrane protein